MKKFIFCLTFFIWSTLTLAQTNTTYEFIGTLQLSNNELISYKLSFKDLANGKIEGNSITDIYGDDRTKSLIKGNINFTDQKISFIETANLSTKSKASESDFCYLIVKNAKFKTVRGKTILQGKFSGKLPNGKVCANGTLYLISTNYLQQLENNYLNANKIKNADTLSMLKEKIGTLKDRVDKNTLKSNEVLSINWSSNEVILEIWDGEQEDLDEIQVYINDKKIVDQLVLKRQKKILIIPLTEKVSSIKIIGINEGLSAPCTANIILRDGTISTPVISVLKKGESNTIRINKL
jgi:hypothetical protein